MTDAKDSHAAVIAQFTQLNMTKEQSARLFYKVFGEHIDAAAKREQDERAAMAVAMAGMMGARGRRGMPLALAMTASSALATTPDAASADNKEAVPIGDEFTSLRKQWRAIYASGHCSYPQNILIHISHWHAKKSLDSEARANADRMKRVPGSGVDAS